MEKINQTNVEFCFICGKKYAWRRVREVTMHAYSSTPFLLLEQLPSQNQVMRREILHLSCKAQKKEEDTLC